MRWLPFKNPSLKARSWPQITVKMLLLSFCLQCLLWYQPMMGLLEKHHFYDVKSQQVLKRLAKQQQLFAQDLPEWLSSYEWLTAEKIQPTAPQDPRLQILFALAGEANLRQWQLVLAQLEESLAMMPRRYQWRKTIDGLWKGEIELQLVPEVSNRIAYPILPIQVRPNMSSENDAYLVSTLTSTPQHKALLMMDDQLIAVSQGDWVPNLGMSVHNIERQAVDLMDDQGRSYQLRLHSRE